MTDPTSYDTDVFPVDNRTAITLGSTVLLECDGERLGLGSFSAPSVVWVRNGEQVVADGSVGVGVSTRELWFGPVGYYTCCLFDLLVIICVI